AIARRVRPATRTDFERSLRAVPDSPYTPDAGFSDPATGLPAGDLNHTVLVEAPNPGGRDELVLYERRKADGVRRMCLDAYDKHASSMGTVCADPAHGFSVPELNGVS